MIRRFGLMLSLVLLVVTSQALAGQAAPLNVVASFSILGDVVQQIAGDHINLTTIIPPDTDPASYELTEDDRAALAEADIVFRVGMGFEPTVDAALDDMDTGAEVVTVSQYVGILPKVGMAMDMDMDMDMPDMSDMSMEAMNRMMCGDSDTCLAHYNEIDQLHADRSFEHTHVMGMGLLFRIDCEEHACDPYLWGDPHNVLLWGQTIRDTLSSYDEAHAEDYQDNAHLYFNDLLTLIHADMKPEVFIVPDANKTVISNIDTLQYYTNSLGFELVGLDAEDLNESIAAATEEHALEHVFLTGIDEETAAQIAEATGATVHRIPYAYGLSEPDGDAPDYIDYMLYLNGVITGALQ